MSTATDPEATIPAEGETLDDQFRLHLARLNVAGLRLAAALSSVLFLLFIILDYFVIPDYFRHLMVIRILCAAYAAALAVVSYYPTAIRHITWLSVSLAIVDALAIAFMVHLHDLQTQMGPSPYYAGLNLVFIAAALLFSWKLRVSVPTFSVVYLMYLVPSLVAGNIVDTPLFLASNFFLVSTMAIVAVAQMYRYQLQHSEFAGAFRLREANERLKEMDRYKTDFFSNITHELKTPLTLILAPVESILSGDLGQFSDQQRDYLKGVYRNSLRLMKLINDLLDLSKLEESRLRLRVEETDLAGFLDVMSDSIRPMADRKNLELVLERGDGDLTVWIDHHRFERVILNLLANATKFTPEGGGIEVRVGGDTDTVNIHIQDTGIGIPSDKLEFVFDRFSQVDSTGTRRYGGTGIGLALARELVNLHGGRLWAESEEGAWTRMSIELQRGKDHFAPNALDRRRESLDVVDGKRADDRGMAEFAVHLEQSAEYRQIDVADATERRLVPRRPYRGIGTSRVLVVEDNHEMLQLIHVHLCERFDVLVADDGAKGWELAQRVIPDLVVTDRMMPVMDGVELCRRLKQGENTQHIPVIMLTAKAALEDRLSGRGAGADEYLAKPFRPQELIAVIDGLLKVEERHTATVVDRELDATVLLSGRMAHELKNPLNYIKNGSELVREAFEQLLAVHRGELDLDDDEREHRVQRLQQRVVRMSKVTNDGIERAMELLAMLKEYTRQGYTRLLQPYPLDEAVAKAVAMADGPDRRDVRIVPELQCGAAVPCVPEELHEVIFNLVKNAVEASPEGGEVLVSTATDGDHAVLTVRDRGEGIAPEARERIFAPFYSSKDGMGGMGLGLAIVRQLVRAMGGDISVESEPGMGAEFTVVLPTSDAAVPPSGAAGSRA